MANIWVWEQLPFGVVGEALCWLVEDLCSPGPDISWLQGARKSHFSKPVFCRV